MKKHDEGYVLAYVMVVLAVLMVIALSVMSVSLTNMERQRADIQRMQDKYTAEGAIEKAIAILGDQETAELLSGIPFGEHIISVEVVEGTVDGNACNIRVTAQKASIRVVCEIFAEFELLEKNRSGEGYTLKSPEVQKFISYRITNVDDAEGGDGDATQP